MERISAQGNVVLRGNGIMQKSGEKTKRNEKERMKMNLILGVQSLTLTVIHIQTINPTQTGGQMRTIKFRGKRTDNGEWVYGSLIQSSLVHGSRYEIKVLADTPESEDKIHEVYFTTVGQFTGLHDKNGKEIYEGDRVKIGDEVVTIFYNDAMASWDIEFEGGDADPIIPDGSYYDPSGFEIIGNIHEQEQQ